MILCLDVGNSQIFGGVFERNEILLRFRHDTTASTTSDQLGIFLKSVLRENGLKSHIKHIAVCSVVPSIDYSLRSACIKYFNVDPVFLQADVKTGLDLKYTNPHELGADRLANAIAAVDAFPNKNLIIIDFGTATTFCAINKKKAYLGGAILAGMKLSMNALQANTAKLFAVEIVKPDSIVGRTTKENIQSGLYFGQLGIIREFTQKITHEHFKNEKPIIIGTGGFSYLFEQEGIFTTVMPDLILQGLRLVLKLNT
jgi:type III pantothenate kinase